ncbi:MAG: SUF system Fe-S cluster assembly regulator, partial [Alphaproteobacteria bacterium]|nr:SUF system Fe-S cluster assembly regulator [Alphaproteobacteria bacterium]
RHDEISIAAVIEAMDGPIAITDCAEGSTHQSCNIEGICPLSTGWNKVNHAVKHALEEVSLADMNIAQSPALTVDLTAKKTASAAGA